MTARDTLLNHLWEQQRNLVVESAGRVFGDAIARCRLREEETQELVDELKKVAVEAFQRARVELGEDAIGAIQWHPDTTTAMLLRTYAKHFSQLKSEDLSKIGVSSNLHQHFNAEWEGEKQRMQDDCEAEISVAFKVLSELDRLIAQGDFTKSEHVVRGQLALAEDNVEMINALFDLGCLAGKAELVCEARGLQERLMSQPGATFHPPEDAVGIQRFLQLAVVKTVFIHQSASLAITDLSLLTQNARTTVMCKAAQEVQRRIIARGNWTPQELLIECKEVFCQTCADFAQQHPGMELYPSFGC